MRRMPVSPRRSRSIQVVAFNMATGGRFASLARAGPITAYTGVYKPLAPLLILIGENDDWTPAEPCRKLTDAAQAAVIR
jgi:dienelactone hydrolase